MHMHPTVTSFDSIPACDGQTSRHAAPMSICHIVIINIVQNTYTHKRKAKKTSKKHNTVTMSLYAQMFYGRTDVIFGEKCLAFHGKNTVQMIQC